MVEVDLIQGLERSETTPPCTAENLRQAARWQPCADRGVLQNGLRLVAQSRLEPPAGHVEADDQPTTWPQHTLNLLCRGGAVEPMKRLRHEDCIHRLVVERDCFSGSGECARLRYTRPEDLPHGRERLDRYDPEEGCWQEVVVEDHRTGVADLVAFRIDFREWLRTKTV